MLISVEGTVTALFTCKSCIVFPIAKHVEQFVFAFWVKRFFCQLSQHQNRFAHLGKIGGAATAARNMFLETHVLFVRKRTIQIITYKLDKLSASQRRHCINLSCPNSPQGRGGQTHAPDGAALVDLSR